MRPFKHPATPARQPCRPRSATATWTGRQSKRRAGAPKPPRRRPGRRPTPTKRDQPRNAKARTLPPFCIVTGQGRTMAGAAHSGTFCHTRGVGARSGFSAAPEVGWITWPLGSDLRGPRSRGVRAGCCLPAAPMGGSRPWTFCPWRGRNAPRDHPGRQEWLVPGQEGKDDSREPDAVQARAGDAFHPVSRPDSQRRGGDDTAGQS